MTPQKNSPQGGSFLVLDFDAKILSTIHRYLTIEGAQSVFTANTTQEGLDMLRTKKPKIECIVCAEDLAPQTGIEFLKELRSGRHGDSMRDIRFVMLTAHREVALVEVAKKLDVNGYILKPVDYNSFAHHIREALAHAFKPKASKEYLRVDLVGLRQLPVILGTPR